MIQPATVEFLADLKENNDREWFAENKKAYQAAKDNLEEVVAQIILGLVPYEPEFANLEAKKSIFRIFRDARFSKNKAPYKPNMGAWMTRGGRKSPYAGFYLHVEPGGNSFLAGGVYHPESKILKAIREGIDYDAGSLREIIADPIFIKQFGEMEGEKVKTSPKGYSKDHPALDLLRHKSFLMSQNLSDAKLVENDFVEKALKVFHAMIPLNNYLNLSVAEAAEEAV